MIFQTDDNNFEFNKNGFITIENFFDENEISLIKSRYDLLKLGEFGHIYTNIFDKDPLTNINIAAFLYEMFAPKIAKYFKNYSLVGGVFLAKGIGENSYSKIHQDWNMVDESKYWSVGVWCPLEDVDENNGCLQVIPGSHKWFKSIRSQNMPSTTFEFKQVEAALKSVPLKKGSLVVFAHNLFHGSKPNYTKNIRPVAYIGVVSVNSQMVHYIKDNNKIKVIKADNDFYIYKVQKLVKGEKLSLEVIDEIAYLPSYVVSESDMNGRLERN
ncbi:MAG: phytanoyl-CoA dioxygenase family protein [Bacteroidia bacterium]|nr:phytanoyl-CoA dioxygenase family protein [Bacteroidia bacterium]